MLMGPGLPFSPWVGELHATSFPRSRGFFPGGWPAVSPSASTPRAGTAGFYDSPCKQTALSPRASCAQAVCASPALTALLSLSCEGGGPWATGPPSAPLESLHSFLDGLFAVKSVPQSTGAAGRPSLDMGKWSGREVSPTTM